MKDGYKVLYAPKALEDLKDLYTYLALELQLPDAAKQQIHRIREAISALSFMSLRHPLVDWEPWSSIGMHTLPVYRLIVFYTVDTGAGSVTIIRIVYGERALKCLADREHE